MEGKKNSKTLNKKFEKEIFGPNIHQAKSGVFSFSVVMMGVGGGGGCWVWGPKNQSCSEWPETCFGFGIFEI